MPGRCSPEGGTAALRLSCRVELPGGTNIAAPADIILCGFE